jgi:hypothetical protein
MDAPSFVTFAIVALGVWFVPRLLFESVGRASDGISQLFVPPDRSLGWPHGVQESDAPWGWRSTPATSSRSTADRPDAKDPELFEIEQVGQFEQIDVDPASPTGGLVVSLRAVRRS